MNKKILFFIGTMHSGGRERRLAELLVYLEKNNFEILLLLTDDYIHYKYIEKLNIKIIIIKRRYFTKNPAVFLSIYSIAKRFDPDIIHTWGIMCTFYSIPSKIFLKKVLISNLIADSKNKFASFTLSNFFFRVSLHFSDIIISNSQAGLNAYSVKNSKADLIYNGINLNRFNKLENTKELKQRLKICGKSIVIMVASASKNKDYNLFLDVAKHIYAKQQNIVFLGVGGGTELSFLNERIDNEKIHNVKMLGLLKDIESLIAASDIGVLFTYSEGISNSIMEYMALGKPVITTDVEGGSRELIYEGESGFIFERNIQTISNKILELINNNELSSSIGEKGKKIIESKFTIEQMGEKYINMYEKVI